MCGRCGKLVSPQTLNYTHQYQCKAVKQEPKIVSKKIIKTIKYLDNKNDDISDEDEEEEIKTEEEIEQVIPQPKAKAKAQPKAKAKPNLFLILIDLAIPIYHYFN